MLSAVTVRDIWCQFLNWTGPSSEAEILFLGSQLESVPNYGDEDSKQIFRGWTSCLHACNRSMSTKPSSRSFISSSAIFPTTTRSRSAPGSTLYQDVEHIVRASWATRKTRQLEQRSASGVTPNPHALVASGGFRPAVEGTEDRAEAVVDRVEEDAEYSSPGLAVEVTITSTASSNSSTPVRRQNR